MDSNSSTSLCIPSISSNIMFLHPGLEESWLRHTTTRRGALAAPYIQQRRPVPHVSAQINGLRHKASITAHGASDHNPYQGVLQTTALHAAHDMSYRS